MHTWQHMLYSRILLHSRFRCFWKSMWKPANISTWSKRGTSYVARGMAGDRAELWGVWRCGSCPEEDAKKSEAKATHICRGWNTCWVCTSCHSCSLVSIILLQGIPSGLGGNHKLSWSGMHRFLTFVLVTVLQFWGVHRLYFPWGDGHGSQSQDIGSGLQMEKAESGLRWWVLVAFYHQVRHTLCITYVGIMQQSLIMLLIM